MLAQETQSPTDKIVLQVREKFTALLLDFNFFLNLLSDLKSFESLPLQGMNLEVIIPFSGLFSLSIYRNSLFIADPCLITNSDLKSIVFKFQILNDENLEFFFIFHSKIATP